MSKEVSTEYLSIDPKVLLASFQGVPTSIEVAKTIEKRKEQRGAKANSLEDYYGFEMRRLQAYLNTPEGEDPKTDQQIIEQAMILHKYISEFPDHPYNETAMMLYEKAKQFTLGSIGIKGMRAAEAKAAGSIQI